MKKKTKAELGKIADECVEELLEIAKEERDLQEKYWTLRVRERELTLKQHKAITEIAKLNGYD